MGKIQAAPDTVEGEPVRKVTAVEHAYAGWSPDGERLVLQSNRAGSWDLYLTDADGSDLVRLTRSPANESTPTWSPDGSRIAYQSDASGDLEIHVLTLEDGAEHRVTHSPGTTATPSGPPTGARSSSARSAPRATGTSARSPWTGRSCGA